jgi:hypothetical protein
MTQWEVAALLPLSFLVAPGISGGQLEVGPRGLLLLVVHVPELGGSVVCPYPQSTAN